VVEREEKRGMTNKKSTSKREKEKEKEKRRQA